MIALDTNILVYAHRPDAPLHERADELLRDLAEGSAGWAIPWPCVHEFYAVVTNQRIWPDATPTDRALAQIETWLESPALSLLSEARDHLVRLRQVSSAADVRGPQMHDARIAAICLSHGVTELITMDRDFSRFPALRTRSLLG